MIVKRLVEDKQCKELTDRIYGVCERLDDLCNRIVNTYKYLDDDTIMHRYNPEIDGLEKAIEKFMMYFD